MGLFSRSNNTNLTVHPKPPRVTRLNAWLLGGALLALILIVVGIVLYSPNISQYMRRSKPKEAAPMITPTPKPAILDVLPSVYAPPQPQAEQQRVPDPRRQRNGYEVPPPEPIQSPMRQGATARGSGRPRYSNTAFPAASPRIADKLWEEREKLEGQTEVDTSKTTNQGKVMPSPGRYVVMAGKVIPVTLSTEPNTDVCGAFKAYVREPVRSSRGSAVLIPQGTEVLGTYDCGAQNPSGLVPLTASRLIFPDTSYMVLDDGFPVIGPLGTPGIKGDVNNHWGRMTLAILLSATLGTGTRYAAGDVSGYGERSPQDDFMMNTGRETSRIGNQIIQRELNVKPTITVPRSRRMLILVNKDLVFDEPYGSTDHD